MPYSEQGFFPRIELPGMLPQESKKEYSLSHLLRFKEYALIFKGFMERITEAEIESISTFSCGRLYKRDLAYARITLIYCLTPKNGNPYTTAICLQAGGMSYEALILRGDGSKYSYTLKSCFQYIRTLKAYNVPKGFFQPEPIQHKTYKAKKKLFSAVPIIPGKKGIKKIKGNKKDPLPSEVEWKIRRVSGSYGSSR